MPLKWFPFPCQSRAASARHVHHPYALLVGIFAVLFVLLNLLLHFVIVRPIVRMSRMATDVASATRTCQSPFAGLTRLRAFGILQPDAAQFRGRAEDAAEKLVAGKMTRLSWGLGSYHPISPADVAPAPEGEHSYGSGPVQDMNSSDFPNSNAVSSLSSRNPLVRWVWERGWVIANLPDLVRGLGHSINEANIPLMRLRLTLRTLHPQLAGLSHVSLRDGDSIEEISAAAVHPAGRNFPEKPLRLALPGSGRGSPAPRYPRVGAGLPHSG